jgi:putative transposase
MNSRFQNRYRIKSSRLPGYNYSLPGIYYITICTWKKYLYFGACQNGEIVLSELGLVVQDEWLKTPEIRKGMNIFLDKYIIMPDHFHAIIHIGQNDFGNGTEITPMPYKNIPGPQSNNLASIIRGFKSAVTKRSKMMHIEFAWQPRYYDHIIRSNSELRRIRNYIVMNPANY